MKTVSKALLVLTLAALSGCDSLPEAYQGQFWNKPAGIRITLRSTDGDIEFRGKKLQNFSAKELKYDTAVLGLPGIYVRQRPGDSMVDIYYMNPNRNAKVSEQGFISVPTEIVYAQMNPRQKIQAKEITVVRCTNGMLLLDKVNNTFELGCPAGAETISLPRVKSSGSVDWNPFT
jgi:hypothetical protein